MRFFLSPVLFFLFFICFSSAHAQNNLSLDEAISRALKNNLGISIAVNDFQGAKNNVTRGNAGFLPNVNLFANETPSTAYSNQSYSTGQKVDKPVFANNVNGGVQLSWVLYNGKRASLEYDRLKELQTLGELGIQTRAEQLVYDVMRAYYSVVRQQELYNGFKDQLNLYEERLRIAQTRLDVGQGNRLDLLTTQSDLSVQKTQLLRQQQLIETGQLILSQLMTEQPETKYTITDTLAVQTVYDITQLKADAVNNNLQTEVLKHQTGISVLIEKEIESFKKPLITFNPSFILGRTDNTAGQLLLNQNAGLNAGFSFSMPIYDGKNIQRQVDNAKIGIASNKLREQQLVFDLKANVNLAYQNYTNAVAVIRAEEENLLIAKQGIGIAMERFRLSRSTILELKLIQQVYESGVNRVISARFDAKMAEIDLLRLSGLLKLKIKN